MSEQVTNKVVTDSGLTIITSQEGSGDVPKPGDVVSVHYNGFLEDGTKFDSSYDRRAPFSFQIGQGRVIKGWDEGVMTMTVGSKCTLIIPPQLGYGERGAGDKIPPQSILVFEIERLS